MYKLPNHEDYSRVWIRLYAFTSNFTPNAANRDAVFGFNVGVFVEDNIAPSFGDYGAAVLEAWGRVEPKEFERLAGGAHRCLDPWPDL